MKNIYRTSIASCALAGLLALVQMTNLQAAVGLETQDEGKIIAWGVIGDWHSADLKVTGAGILPYEATYVSGQTITMSLIDDTGNPVADGTYKWELTVHTQALTTRSANGGVASNASTTESGVFTIKSGGAIFPAAPRTTGIDNDLGMLPRDQVILDDLIVDGSACVGQDCVNGESFGFDTLRLKENNLRIKFDDTSNSASFPNNDWQITINDSSNGGANKFSIDDITGGRTPFTIEAGAPSHSLFVDDGGRLGLGTSTPVTDIHVKSGNTPTTRLEQDGSSGFTSQTWDLAANETNFFIRDATNGSTLPFRIRPGAPSSALDIASDGDVGIGTSNPASALHVMGSDSTLTVGNNNGSKVVATGGDGTTQLLVGDDGGSSAVTTGGDGTTQLLLTDVSPTAQERTMLSLINNGAARLDMTDSTNGIVWSMATQGTEEFIFKNSEEDTIVTYTAEGDVTIAGSVQAGGFFATSDVNVKNTIVPVEPAEILQAVVDMPISEWSYNADATKSRHIGPMAQDFRRKFQLGNSDKTINIADSSGVALAAIQGLSQIVKEKDAEIDALKAKSDLMEKQLQLLIKEVEAIKQK